MLLKKLLVLSFFLGAVQAYAGPGAAWAINLNGIAVSVCWAQYSQSSGKAGFHCNDPKGFQVDVSCTGDGAIIVDGKSSPCVSGNATVYASPSAETYLAVGTHSVSLEGNITPGNWTAVGNSPVVSSPTQAPVLTAPGGVSF